MLNVPTIANGASGNESTFHQDHVVSIHEASFKKMRSIFNDMMTGAIAPPAFMQVACPGLTLAEMIVIKNNDTVAD